ncbi:tape measure protein [Enterococcus faecalis]|nr:tape measure protein [Enterococcus faecalis]
MILDESGFSQGLNSAVKKLQGFDVEVDRTGQKGGRSLGSIWTSFVGNFLASGATKIISKGIGLITSNIDGAINRVDTLNNANRVFENMGFSAGETSKTMDSLKKSIQGLPTPLDSAIKGVQLIASSTNDLGKSEQIFAALNNGILGFGGSAEMVENAIIQLSQSFSNGKVDAETWNSMINSGLGPALNALAKQMGLTAGQMKAGLSDGSISVEEFQDALIKLNKEGGGGLKSLEQIAKDSTAGIKTGLANMKTAIVRGVANVVTKIDEGLKSAGFGSISEIIADKGAKMEAALSKFAEMIPPMIKTAKTLYDTLKPYAPLLAGLAGSIGTLMLAKKVSAAFTAWQKATEGLSILKNVLLAPILFITSMITGGWEEAKENMIAVWDNIAEAAQTIWFGIKNIFYNTVTAISYSVTSIFNGLMLTIKKIWIDVKLFFTLLWIDIKYGAINVWIEIKYSIIETWINIKFEAIRIWESLKTWFFETVENIKNGVIDGWNSLKQGTVDTFNATVQWSKDTWNNFKQWIVDLVTGIKDGIINGWENLKQGTVNIFNNLVQGAKNAWNNLKRSVSDTVENVKQTFNDMRHIDLFEIGKNIIQGLVNGIGSMIGAVNKKIKEVAGNIKEKIKGALGIHSPSRWMRDMIGKNIVLGVVAGIDQEKGTLDKSVKKMTDLPTELPNFSTTGRYINQQGAQTESLAKNKGNATTNIGGDTFNINIQAMGKLNEKQLMDMAKDLVKYIQIVKNRDSDATGGAFGGI